MLLQLRLNIYILGHNSVMQTEMYATVAVIEEWSYYEVIRT
jgi:hypothetical protein